jgi:hypothetical protein
MSSEMTDGTKGGAQRARTLRPRCVGGVDPETATHIYLSGLANLWHLFTKLHDVTVQKIVS